MNRPHVVILGAGASIASTPDGEKHGKNLPDMNGLIKLLGIDNILNQNGISVDTRNFEVLYSKLHAEQQYNDLLQTIEARIFQYFSDLELQYFPSIYDHLVLSLREKDIIATFNWDPFLFQSCFRNHKITNLPHIVYLHGNVAVGYCESDKRKGSIYGQCSICKKPFVPSKLLYPINQKNYNQDPYIKSEWDSLKQYLKDAYLLTIFGYGAPESDIEAINLMKEAWGDPEDRRLEEIEIIDIKTDDELSETWKDFIHSHHYRTYDNFYDSILARYPRRSCEAIWSQLMELEFFEENKIPEDSGFDELHKWYYKIINIEKT